MNMNINLPKNLQSSEEDLFKSLEYTLNKTDIQRISVNIKFEGLRVMPLSFRLAKNLLANYPDLVLAYPDAGDTALAKRDAPDLTDKIFSFNEIIQNIELLSSSKIILAIKPQYFDFETFQTICESHLGKIVMFNGKLEEAAVGIGSVARERRKGLISKWEISYWLEPMEKGALMKKFPDEWSLFSYHPDGYRYLRSFTNKPTMEEIVEYLL